MHPPRQRFPMTGALIIGHEAVYDDARRGSHAAIGVAPIPDVTGKIALVGGAGMAFLVTKPIDLTGAKGGANGDSPEAFLKRL